MKYTAYSTIITLSIFLSMGTFAVNAQPIVEWDKTLGGSYNDEFMRLAPSADGGFLLAGWSSSPASRDKSEGSKGGDDYWIINIDAQGNKLWDKTYGGSGFDELRNAIPTMDEGYLILGHSRSDASGDKSENSKGGADYWVIKIDAQGNKEWDRTLGSSNSDYLYHAAQNADGSYLLGGTSSSGISGDKSENSLGFDYWLVKLDSEGNKQWDKTIGGSSDETLIKIFTTSDGGYLLPGISSSNISGDKSENSRGGRDYWVVKIDALGNKQWDKTLGGNQDDWLEAASLQTDGSYMLAGWSSSSASGDKSENSKGETDFWAVKIDA
ncbi:putative secreted protein [Catalinimonas alkaloidigena]|uniref:hypothetical protein n=1 Tax=Catalinimonas alkaloidigena TaxID=1075417 RepID=UPI002406A324|nr:hypothetical protein [Catalinimonas alkaloidigena]MDF9796527.1 putative secreted protein [Catalinimonas alkaloidigena]